MSEQKRGQAIDIAGPEKILYGTDFSLGKASRVAEVDAVLDAAGLSDAERSAIYHDNAARLLGLP